MPNLVAAAPPVTSSLTSRQRWISFAEVALGSLVVIGHNVFHVLPNEVPILFVLFWISSRLREGRWIAVSLQRPKSWFKTIALAILAAAVLQVGSELIIQPLASHLWHRPEHISSLMKVPVHSRMFGLRNLAIVWIFAALGEEVGYRGYLLPRAADLGNRSKMAYIAALFYVALLFGFGHFYKGPAGIMDSTYSGLVLGSVYLLSGRNLWASILAHGISDTFAVIVVFMGWAT